MRHLKCQLNKYVNCYESINYLYGCISDDIWACSSVLTTRVQSAYNAGFRDGKNAFTIDSQCAAWLMNSNLKEAKERICK